MIAVTLVPDSIGSTMRVKVIGNELAVDDALIILPGSYASTSKVDSIFRRRNVATWSYVEPTPIGPSEVQRADTMPLGCSMVSSVGECPDASPTGRCAVEG